MTTYLLDTSALIDDADVFYHFGADDTVLISTTTLRELDGLKESKRGNVSQQARGSINVIDSCRKKGVLSEGVELDNGSTLVISAPPRASEVYEVFGVIEDTEIIATGLQYAKDSGDEVYAVSIDSNFRVTASIVGLSVFEYTPKEKVKEMEKYLGYVEYDDVTLENSLRTNGTLHIAKIPEEITLYDGTYVVFGHSSLPCIKRTIGIVKGEYVELVEGAYMNNAGRFKVKNIGQRVLAHALMDKDRTVITCEGVAGTGKTLEALAYALRQVDEAQYTKVICYRAIAELDQGLGHLPGSMDEKLAPWTQPFFDNLEFLDRVSSVRSPFEEDEADGAIEIQALTYARGRSLPKVIIIVDEAQNLTRLQAKTMATRLGEDAKIVFLYDREQIDHKYLDRYNNGGVHVASKLRGQSIHAHVTLTETVRSKTASICAKLL